MRPANASGKPDNRTHFTLQGLPGGALNDQVVVSNASKVAATFSIYGTDAFNTPTGAFDLLPAAAKPVDVGSWVSFPQSEVTIPAGGSVSVPFKVTIPALATSGDHAGGVVVSLATGTNVRLDTRVAVRLYLRIAGLLRPLLGVQDVAATYHGVGDPFGKGRVTITYTVTNPGNIRLRSHPSAVVTALFGAVVGRAKAGDLTELLPGQRATFSLEVTGVFPAGPLTGTVELQPYPDPEQPVGQSVPLASGSGGVWAVSWFLVLLILVLLVLIGVLVRYVLVRLRRRREAARAAERQAAKEAREARKPKKGGRKSELADARVGGAGDDLAETGGAE
jgi:hypothetical protein